MRSSAIWHRQQECASANCLQTKYPADTRRQINAETAFSAGFQRSTFLMEGVCRSVFPVRRLFDDSAGDLRHLVRSFFLRSRWNTGKRIQPSQIDPHFLFPSLMYRYIRHCPRPENVHSVLYFFFRRISRTVTADKDLIALIDQIFCNVPAAYAVGAVAFPIIV